MKPRCRTAFTLVELLVVITIIGMLAALLLPAINHAREAARSADCMNRQRSMGMKILEFATNKDYFPGYRNVFTPIPIVPDTSNPNPKFVVNWQVLLWPYLEREDLYQHLRDQSVSSINNGNFVLPYLDFSVCPSDNTTVNRSAPLTSYVVNTGRLDKFDIGGLVMGQTTYTVDIADPPQTSQPNMAESFQNGIFQDRVLTTAKQSTGDFKDGQANTLMLSENIDASCYTDGPWPGSDSPLILLDTTDPNPKNWPLKWAQQLTSTAIPHNCSERGAGFVWWDTSAKSTTVNPPPVPTGSLIANGKLSALKAQVVVINGRPGDFEPSRVGWPTDAQTKYATDYADPYAVNSAAASQVNTYFAARPSSNHPGGVNVVFADGRCKFLSDDIDYSVYCLLMTPNGGPLAPLPSTPSTDSQFNNKTWQYYTPLTEGQF